MMIFLIVSSTGPIKEVASSQTIQTIPDEAIRLRILANSDDEKDQEIKRLVRDEVNVYIEELVMEMDDIEEAREAIAAHLPNLKDIVQETLNEKGITDSFTVEYKSNVSFPLKVYDDYVYPAGEYEAVLITIGDGKGANWWCVLFPPLCFLDFSNGTTIDDNFETKETSNGDASDKKDEVEQDASESESNTEIITVAQDRLEKNVEETDEEEVKVTFFFLEWFGWS